MHAWKDKRICGLILLNPWVRTGAGIARATLRHYYPARLLQADFWHKLAAGQVAPLAVLRSLYALAAAGANGKERQRKPDLAPQRLYAGLARFDGRILIILSGDDLTAREFDALSSASPAWRKLMARPQLSQVKLAQANHTFSRGVWRDEVAAISADWITSW
jgi:hypothetical protein